MMLKRGRWGGLGLGEILVRIEKGLGIIEERENVQTEARLVVTKF
jgi:hypothetical protein